MISKEELLQIKAKLEADVVDDPEDLLTWLALKGPDLIDELLKLREQTIDAADLTSTT